MQRLYFSLIFTLYLFAVHGQTTFNILPDVGGINKQGMGLLGIADSFGIIIIGHRYDTVLPGPNTKPYLAHFDYSGQLQYALPIKDLLYNEPFNISNSAVLVEKNDSIFYFSALRGIGGQYFQPYIMELNVNSGTVLRSEVLINEDYPLLPYEGGCIKKVDNNTLLFLNTLNKEDSIITYLTLLDSTLNEIEVIKVKSSNKKSFAVSCDMIDNDLFIIAGYCLVENGPLGDFYPYYLDSVDSNGNVLAHTLAPTTIPISRGVYGTNTILQDIEGNWIIGGTHQKDLPALCDDCYELIPYIFSTTPDFKTLLWETRYFDVPFYGAPQYFLYSITHVEDGYIVSGDFFNYEGFDSGVLFKASLNGDSLWMKHYIPLEWEEDRVGAVRFFDIQTTPYETIVVTGVVGDIEENIIRPWILHLDKDGCLVPGCNTVATHDESNSSSHKNFTIYPNPTSSEIYVLSHITSPDPLMIGIFSNEGTEIHKRSFEPVAGYQYTLPVSDLPSGIYFLVFMNPKSGQLENYKFIHE